MDSGTVARSNDLNAWWDLCFRVEDKDWQSYSHTIKILETGRCAL